MPTSKKAQGGKKRYGVMTRVCSAFSFLMCSSMLVIFPSSFNLRSYSFHCSLLLNFAAIPLRAETIKKKDKVAILKRIPGSFSWGSRKIKADRAAEKKRTEKAKKKWMSLTCPAGLSMFIFLSFDGVCEMFQI